MCIKGNGLLSPSFLSYWLYKKDILLNVNLGLCTYVCMVVVEMQLIPSVITAEANCEAKSCQTLKIR